MIHEEYDKDEICEFGWTKDEQNIDALGYIWILKNIFIKVDKINFGN